MRRASIHTCNLKWHFIDEFNGSHLELRVDIFTVLRSVNREKKNRKRDASDNTVSRNH